MTNSKRLGMVITVFLMSLMFLPAIAEAQDFDISHGAEGAEVSSDQINAFTRATGQIIQIQQMYQGQLEAAQNNEQRQAIMHQANSEMVEAVEAEGLSPQEYNTIAQQAQSDPTLMQRIQESQL